MTNFISDNEIYLFKASGVLLSKSREHSSGQLQSREQELMITMNCRRQEAILVCKLMLVRSR